LTGKGKFKLGGYKLVAGVLAFALLGGVWVFLALGTGLSGFSFPWLSRLDKQGIAAAGEPLETGGKIAGYRQLALEPLVVNLADAGGRRFVRVSITLEFTDACVEKELARVDYRVRDAIIQVLRSKTAADLAPQRAEEVREELLATINSLLADNKVTGLYFQEFIIQ